MGSGSEITSSNDDASYGKVNRKQILLDTGSSMQAASRAGAGQMGYCEGSGSALKGDNYYSIDFGSGACWFPFLSKLIGRSNFAYFQPNSGTLSNDVGGHWTLTTASGTPTLQSLDNTDGRSVRFTTGGGAGNQAGFREDNRYVIRKFAPVLRIKFKNNETSNIRMFIGLADTTSNLGNNDDPLNALSGIGIAISTASSLYRIFHNDSSGATISDSTAITVDTNSHDFDLYGDNTNTRWMWNLDDDVFGFITTDIPAETTNLAFQATYTTTTAAARSFEIFQGCMVSMPQN